MAIKFHWMLRDGWQVNEEGLTSMAKELEEVGIESVLLPYGPRGVDFSVYINAILKATKKIRMMLALPAYGVTPEYAAKTFKAVNNFCPNRLDLNLVAGRYDEERENLVVKSYPGDTEIIDSHDKRVSITEPWMNRFVSLIKEYSIKPRLCVVGSSDTTISIANNQADYLIVGEYMLNYHFLRKITDCKLILIIDPLVIKDGQDSDTVEYYHSAYAIKPNHSISGTEEQVIEKIIQISKEFKINDFIIVTDQIDTSGIFGVVKRLTKVTAK